jgi:hypothetical protein
MLPHLFRICLYRRLGLPIIVSPALLPGYPPVRAAAVRRPTPGAGPRFVGARRSLHRLCQERSRVSSPPARHATPCAATASPPWPCAAPLGTARRHRHGGDQPGMRSPGWLRCRAQLATVLRISPGPGAAPTGPDRTSPSWSSPTARSRPQWTPPSPPRLVKGQYSIAAASKDTAQLTTQREAAKRASHPDLAAPGTTRDHPLPRPRLGVRGPPRPRRPALHP